ncbi:MAG: isocitrate lyase/PEP mutase family protein [Candidatus Dormibacteria bacterium]
MVPCHAPGRTMASERHRWERLASLASRLRTLHVPGDPLLLPNVWDVASARLVEELGFPVIATSSSAVAASLGAADDDSMGAELAFGAVTRIAAAVRAPVTADLERGYGVTPTELIRGLLMAGAVGCNVEDSDHHGPQGLVRIDTQAEYLAGLRAAATASGVPVVVNARVDIWLRGSVDPSRLLDEGVCRARAYLEAGADCVYPILLNEQGLIESFVKQVEGPVNVLLGADAPDLATMRRLGVARVSLGSGLHRAAMTATSLTARALLSP